MTFHGLEPLLLVRLLKSVLIGDTASVPRAVRAICG